MTNLDQRPLPDGWRWAKLGDICTITMGQSPEGSTYNVDGIGEPLLNGPTEFGDKYPHPIQWTTSPVRFAEPNDILLCVRGATTGRKNVADQRYCIGRGLAAIHGNGQQAITEFLWFALDIVTETLLKGASGSTFLNLPGDKLQNVEVPLPPLDEQRRIAAILSDQLAAVERARSAAQMQLEAASALPAAYLQEVFGNSHQGQLKRLGDILQLRKEVVHPYDKPSGPAVFVGLEHIESGTGIRIGSESVEMSKLTGRKPRFYKGDIVYGYLRPYLNKLWVAEFDGLCSVDQYVYSVDATQADTAYVAWFMRSPSYLKTAPIDTTPGQLPRIRLEEVAAVEFNLPALNEQQQVVNDLELRLASAQHARQALQAQLDGINQLPAALLRQAFNGEV